MDATTKAAFVALNQTLHQIIEGKETADVNTKNDKLPLFREDIDAYVTKLSELQKAMEQKATFNVGDIVVWKEGLRNRKYPDYNQPAIVINVNALAKPDTDNEIPDLYDLQIGYIINDEDDGEEVFLSFNVNSNRFTQYKKPEDAK